MPDRTTSARDLARRLGISHTAIQKAAHAGRIQQEPDGTWDVARVRRDLVATAEPGRSALAPAPPMESPYARLRLAQLALKVEAQRLALDQEKGKLIDVAAADTRIDEIAGTMRDAVLNWPARVAGVIAAQIGADPHLVQTLLQEHMAALLQGLADRWDPDFPAQANDVIEAARKEQ
jgi:alkylation response protein AidB-like acyl-CoA dehydrogenase